MKKKTRIFAAMLSGILLLAGCVSSSEDLKTTTVPPAAAQEENTASVEQKDVASAEASLVSLRQAMVETPQLFAVAYFGYHETQDAEFPVDPFAVIQENAPQLCADLPFLLEIPEDRVIGTGGDLFCIVPLDEDATVATAVNSIFMKSPSISETAANRSCCSVIMQASNRTPSCTSPVLPERLSGIRRPMTTCAPCPFAMTTGMICFSISPPTRSCFWRKIAV